MKNYSVADWALVVVVALFSSLRLFHFTSGEAIINTESLFKTAAHLVTFGLIGAWLVSWRRFYLILALVFTLVEAFAFFVL